MTLQEIKRLKYGEDVARGDGAVGIVLQNDGAHIQMCWVDTRGQRSIETLEFFKLLSMVPGTPTPMVTIEPGRY